MRVLNPCILCSTPAPGARDKVVCHNCRTKVTRYDALVASVSEAGEFVYVPTGWASVPGQARSGAGEKLMNLLVKLTSALPVPFPGSHVDFRDTRFSDAYGPGGLYGFGSHASRCQKVEPRLVPKVFAELLAHLHPLVCTIAEDSESAGNAAGVNLLAQLNAGTLLTDDFERRAGISRNRNGEEE